MKTSTVQPTSAAEPGATLPTYIQVHSGTASRKVAGTTVLDRLVVAAARAIGGPIILVSEEPVPRLRRSGALGIEIRQGILPGPGSGPFFLLSTDALVTPSDLHQVRDRGGRLEDASGQPLPIGRVPDGARETSAEALLREEHGHRAGPVAGWVRDERETAERERRLWASLESASDGLVDRYFNRPVGRWLSRLLIHTEISPNQVSVLSTLLGVMAAWLFAQGQPTLFLWGAILLQVSAIVDCVDGDLARVLFKESVLGKWLDIGGDQVVHLGLFLGIGIGLWRADSTAPVLVLAGAAAVGVVLSFLVVLRGLRQSEDARNTRLQKLIDATTNRDFSVLLLVLVLLGHLEIFLWMTAIGVHCFWILALAVQCFNHPARPVMEGPHEDPS